MTASFITWWTFKNQILILLYTLYIKIIEPPHDKTNKVACASSKDSVQPGHPPSLIRVFAVRMGSLPTQWAHSEDSDQTGQMPRPIWVFAGGTLTLFVLSCCGLYVFSQYSKQPFPWWTTVNSLNKHSVTNTTQTYITITSTVCAFRIATYAANL